MSCLRPLTSSCLASTLLGIQWIVDTVRTSSELNWVAETCTFWAEEAWPISRIPSCWHIAVCQNQGLGRWCTAQTPLSSLESRHTIRRHAPHLNIPHRANAIFFVVKEDPPAESAVPEEETRAEAHSARGFQACIKGAGRLRPNY